MSYRFAHEPIRRTLLVGLSIRRRQRTHLRIADVLEKKAPENFSSIAHQLFQAGASADLDKTVHYLKLAGERELETQAFQEALDHFDSALSLLEDESAETRAGPPKPKKRSRRGTKPQPFTLRISHRASRITSARSASSRCTFLTCGRPAGWPRLSAKRGRSSRFRQSGRRCRGN